MKNPVLAAAALLASSLLLYACGGSSGSPSVHLPAAGTISGSVVLGPVSGASVHAYAVSGGTMGAQVGGGTTDAAGNFTISIGHYAGPLMLQTGGGSYTDEATGTIMSVPPGDQLACAIPAVAVDATTSGIQVTPLTSMAHARVHHMAGGITDANIATANSAVGGYFSVSDILHVAPMNPTVAGSGAGASQDARNYGMGIAAMSQYAHGLGMTTSSGIVTAMMDDAADGVMDGMMSGSAIPMGGGMMGGTMMASTAGTSGMSDAMAAFIGSVMNKSGLTMTDMQALMTKLAGSSGQLPGAGGATSPGMISGAVTKGPIAGATVTAHAIAGGMIGAQLGTAISDASGHYSVSMGSYTGPVSLQVNGGSYTDEASGTTMQMSSGDVMAACLDATTAGATMTGIQVTPLTSMASARAAAMSGGMTPVNITAANAAVGSYFMVGDILRTTPMDPTVAGAGAGATQDQRNYGMALAAMAQEAMALGMTSSSGMVTALMDDAADGVMDGMRGSTAVSMMGMGGMMGGTLSPGAGTTGMADAMAAFIGSAMNRSGVAPADMQALMAQLAGSNGQLPGAAGATTPHGMVSGTASMGTMTGGTMTAYAVNGGTMGAMIGSAVVGAGGAFTIPLGAYAGTVMLEMSGGTFMDEGTGTSMMMQPGDVLTACIPSVDAGATMTGIQVTPLTSMAQAMAQYMAGGMTTANAAAANAGVGSYFMSGDILMTMPMDPSVAGSGTGASQDMRDYGTVIAAMSQYAKTLGMMGSSSGMVTAMVKDASDGVMNGKMGSTAISMSGMGGGMMGGGSMMPASAGTAGLASAMAAFMSSAMNRSGVPTSSMQPLIDKLSTSTGAIPVGP
jgi:hypothetical protein